MSSMQTNADSASGLDSAPGDSAKDGNAQAVFKYFIGLVLAAGLTVASFWVLHTHLVYGPGIPMAIITFAVAQMGIHLVFFLHISTGPDNTNNILALAFGILIVCLVIFGSLWIMSNLNHNMIPMEKLMRMQH